MTAATARAGLRRGDERARVDARGGDGVSKFKRVRRVYLAICKNCSGSGYLATKHGPVRCPMCVNGDVERVLNEIIHTGDDE